MGLVNGIRTDDFGNVLHTVQFKSKRISLNLADVHFCIRSKPPTYEADIDLSGKETIYGQTLTREFVIAQSVLARIYGQQEQGYKTLGHKLTSSADVMRSKDDYVSLLYGELLPIGLDKALDCSHLNVSSCRTLLELGSGVGKVALQIFLQCRQIAYIYGCEIFQKRYSYSVGAIHKLVELFPARLSLAQTDSNSTRILEVRGRGQSRMPHGWEHGVAFDERCEILKDNDIDFGITRELHVEKKSFLLVEPSLVQGADIIILEIDVPEFKREEMLTLLRHMHCGARILTYLNLADIWNSIYNFLDDFPWRQLEVNVSTADRFATSWSPNRGHHFYLWTKFKK